MIRFVIVAIVAFGLGNEAARWNNADVVECQGYDQVNFGHLIDFPRAYKTPFVIPPYDHVLTHVLEKPILSSDDSYQYYDYGSDYERT